MRSFVLVLLVAALVVGAESSSGSTSQVWLTTADGKSKLERQADVVFSPVVSNTNANTASVSINEAITYQEMDGFGFALTEGSCEVISRLDDSIQEELLRELFDPKGDGIRISIIRISIGASDLSNSPYSCWDSEAAGFAFSPADQTYLVPMLQRIVKINPEIKILATPWSAPRWMKSNNAWVGGVLLKEHYGDYAKYFVDYLQAIKAALDGVVSVWGITVQNEPENPNNNPSMVMTAEEQLDFIDNYLGPAMEAADLLSETRIIGYDHNCDDTNFPIKVAASQYVHGSAFHLYAGSETALSVVRNATNKPVYFTEQWTSSAGQFAGDMSWHTEHVTMGTTSNWARSVLEWNLATDSSFGPHTDGGCTQCLGALTTSTTTTSNATTATNNNNANSNSSSLTSTPTTTAFTRNVAYYIIGHFSKFVAPGSVRIECTSTNNSADESYMVVVVATAFSNPLDSSKTAVVLNKDSSQTVSFDLVWNGQYSLNYALCPGCVVTFHWV